MVWRDFVNCRCSFLRELFEKDLCRRGCHSCVLRPELQFLRFMFGLVDAFIDLNYFNWAWLIFENNCLEFSR